MKFGTVLIGREPRVVTVLTSIEALTRFAALETKPSHLAEIRLDHVGHEKDWTPICSKINIPAILTLRANYEGGKCSGTEEERLKILQTALPQVAAVDVELKSGLAEKLHKAGKPVIVSYHNFSATPTLDELRRITREAFANGDVAKISTMINRPADLGILEKLLEESWPGPLCVIGMGDLGVKTRTEFPKRGSCLTYGYFDKPAAPGQLSAATLMELLG